MPADVVIIGGGLIGCTIALELARKGVAVTLVERVRLCTEATWASAGMLAPQIEIDSRNDFFDFCYRGLELYPQYIEELRELTGLDSSLRVEGALQVAFDEVELKKLAKCYRWQFEAGLPIEELSAEQLREHEPGLSDEVLGGYLFPQELQLDNRRLAEAVVAAAQKLGVNFVIGADVTEILIDRNRGRLKAIGVRAGNDMITAGVVINAAGCWSGGIRVEGAKTPKLIPVRGQMVALRTTVGRLRRIIHTGHTYLVPRLDGRIIVGTTFEYVGYDKRVTAEALQMLLARAIKTVPALAKSEVVEFWSGLRPATEDKRPLLGYHPEVDALIYATGHYRDGVLLAPITAKLIAALVVDGTEDAVLRLYSPARVL
ncbi:MAG: glycine oxidase ThiO [Acidobacteriota bacterium]|nr:glycine oxidase ThiO [Blastocatellia bacterium]MDW8413535.1 glycine oxidase ThiO [Acidobacteriota bacterium]